MTEADKYLAICLRIRYNNVDNSIMRELLLFKGETMKRAGKLALLLFALTLTTVLGGCQDKKESGKESANNESSTETKAEPTMGGSIVVGIP